MSFNFYSLASSSSLDPIKCDTKYLPPRWQTNKQALRKLTCLKLLLVAILLTMYRCATSTLQWDCTLRRGITGLSPWIFNQVVIQVLSTRRSVITDHNQCPSSEIPQITTIQGVKLSRSTRNTSLYKYTIRWFKSLRCSITSHNHDWHDTPQNRHSMTPFRTYFRHNICDQLSIAYRVNVYSPCPA